MDISVTEDGLKALIENKSLSMVKFIAGSSSDLQSMKDYLSSTDYTGPYSYYQYDVDSSQTYLKGDTYTKPDGTEIVCTENFLEVIGSLNCRNVPASFSMKSLGVVAQAGSDQSSRFIYAFGGLSSSDTPYPVNRTEAITYITPVRIVYDSSSDVTLEDPHVPWKNFIQHTDTSVNSVDGAHGLKINPNTKEMTVGGVTINLSASGERIDALEREVQGVLKYHQSDSREYNSEWVQRISGSGTSGDPWRIYTPYDLNLIRTSEFGAGTGYYSLENNLDLEPCIGIRATVTNEGYTVETIDDTAPCFNHGFGWECLSLYQGHFNGNNHWIKGLFIGPIDSTSNFNTYYPTVPYGQSKDDYIRYRSNLFFRVRYNSVLENLHLIDSVILGGDSRGDWECRISSFCGILYGGSTIRNCSSYADIVSANNRYSVTGGIVAECETFNSALLYNAFHGSLNFFLSSRSSGQVGGIAGRRPMGSSSNFEGNYSTADVSFGNTRGGLVGSVDSSASGPTVDLVSNYYTGYVYPKDNTITYVYSLIGYYGVLDDIQIARRLRFSYSLENSAPSPHVQGTMFTREYMMSRDFVDLLNSTLTLPRFVYREGSFPRLDYEEDENTPYTAPIATIDTSNNYVLDSGYTVRTIAQMATSEDLAITTNVLTSKINTKNTLTTAEVTIRTTDWGNPGWNSKSYYWYTDLVVPDTPTRNVIPIPPDLDFFNYGISVAYVTYNSSGSHPYEMYVDFHCTTVPLVDITFQVLIITS